MRLVLDDKALPRISVLDHGGRQPQRGAESRAHLAEPTPLPRHWRGG